MATPIGHWGECTTDLLIYDLYNNGCNRLTTVLKVQFLLSFLFSVFTCFIGLGFFYIYTILCYFEWAFHWTCWVWSLLFAMLAVRRWRSRRLRSTIKVNVGIVACCLALIVAKISQETPMFLTPAALARLRNTKENFIRRKTSQIKGRGNNRNGSRYVFMAATVYRQSYVGLDIN